jgi:serine/threonine-protein kinase
LIGIVADKGQKKVLAYYCDDKTVGQWFEGTLGTDGTFDLTNASGSRLQGTVTATGVDGTLDLVQAARSDPLAALVIPLRGQLALQEHFNATSVTGQEGIYRVQTTENGSQYTGGWVVENTRIRAGLVKKATQVIGATPFDPEKSPTVTTADGVVLRPALVDTIIALSA